MSYKPTFELLEERLNLSPTISLPTNLVETQSNRFSVPINIDNTDGLITGEVVVNYDPKYLTATGVTAGDIDLKSIFWGSFNNTTGEAVFFFDSFFPPITSSGSVANIAFVVNPSAVPGSTKVSVVSQSQDGLKNTGLNDGSWQFNIGDPCNIAINSKSAVALQLLSPTTAVVGKPFTIAVVAHRADGQVDINYNNTVSFARSSVQLTSGIGLLNITLNNAGKQTINVTDGNISGITTLTVFNTPPPVVNQPTTKLLVIAPYYVEAGRPFEVLVAARCADGTISILDNSNILVNDTQTNFNQGLGLVNMTMIGSGIKPIKVTKDNISLTVEVSVVL